MCLQIQVTAFEDYGPATTVNGQPAGGKCWQVANNTQTQFSDYVSGIGEPTKCVINL